VSHAERSHIDLYKTCSRDLLTDLLRGTASQHLTLQTLAAWRLAAARLASCCQCAWQRVCGGRRFRRAVSGLPVLVSRRYASQSPLLNIQTVVA
jgi:hypothetical protein